MQQQASPYFVKLCFLIQALILAPILFYILHFDGMTEVAIEPVSTLFITGILGFLYFSYVESKSGVIADKTQKSEISGHE